MEEIALINELCSRFEQKPRKCRKTNDSFIGQAERIVCISNETFFYYPKIQEFQDLDFDKLQYVVPKAGVKLKNINQLQFPPREKNERKYFSITIPKNKILKFTKNLKQIIVDQAAEGEQIWTFHFDYDIVALPIKERKMREAKLKQIEYQKFKRVEAIRLKQKQEQENTKTIQEQITSLEQVEQMRSQNNEDYRRKKMQQASRQRKQQTILEADELFFHFIYRKLLNRSLSDQQKVSLQLTLLERVGDFKRRVDQTVREFIDELPYTSIKLKMNYIYKKNNLLLKFGQKQINHQFLNNNQCANNLYQLRNTMEKQIRVPLMALVKYKGFKVLARAITEHDDLSDKDFDEALMFGKSKETWKSHFLYSDYLNSLLQNMKLKPYFSEVHYQKVQIHLGTEIKVAETKMNPFSDIKALDPTSFEEDPNYQITYIYDIEDVFPIDLDLESNANQSFLKLRPEYVKYFIKNNKQKIEFLSAGSLTYIIEDEEGEKEDLIIAKASQMLKFQLISLFVKALDRLDFVPHDSASFSYFMKQNGINMRYLNQIIKITQLPYIRIIAEVEGICRIIRNIYREHQRQFIDNFRTDPLRMILIKEMNNSRTSQSMRNVRLKQLRTQQEKQSRKVAIDFLNLIFGISEEFEPFWNIISKQVFKKYSFRINDPTDYPHGYLLQSVLYHCGFSLQMDNKLRLFSVAYPFSEENKLGFLSRVKTFEFPSMLACRLANGACSDSVKSKINQLQLKILIRKALRLNDSIEIAELSQHISTIGPPKSRASFQALLYSIYHATADNFDEAYGIAMRILPSSHPLMLDLYLTFAKITDLDPISLKGAAENHAIRNLGLKHWKTSQILTNFHESDYIIHLKKAEIGVEEERRSDLYLEIIKQYARVGKIEESLSFVSKSIAYFKKPLTSEKDQRNYFQIMMEGIKSNYRIRRIQSMVKMSETLYESLEKYGAGKELIWYESLLYYSFKGFLESNKHKYYLFKLILVLNQKRDQPAVGEERRLIYEGLRVKWKEARNHVNYIKEMLVKLEFGFTQLNDKEDFFIRFDAHQKKLKSDDFSEGLKDFNELFLLFGFKYFEEALLDNIYAFEKIMQDTEQFPY